MQEFNDKPEPQAKIKGRLILDQVVSQCLTTSKTLSTEDKAWLHAFNGAVSMQLCLSNSYD